MFPRHNPNLTYPSLDSPLPILVLYYQHESFSTAVQYTYEVVLWQLVVVLDHFVAS